MYLVRHMNSEHNAYYGLEYLLASCTMSEEERGAVREVTRCVFVVAYLLMILVVGDLRCCLGGRQGGHQVCLCGDLVFVVDFVLFTRST